MENECCICLNDIEEGNIFRLECCKQIVHHDCIVNWINVNINRNLSEYNKCIICKSYNQTIDYYYNDMINNSNNNSNNNTYINLDNSSNEFIIVVNPITENNRLIQLRFTNCMKIILCFSFILILIIIILPIKMN